MRPTSLMVEPNRIDQGDETAAADDPLALMRGLVHGIILSMAVWTVVLYLTLLIR